MVVRCKCVLNGSGQSITMCKKVKQSNAPTMSVNRYTFHLGIFESNYIEQMKGRKAHTQYTHTHINMSHRKHLLHSRFILSTITRGSDKMWLNHQTAQIQSVIYRLYKVLDRKKRMKIIIKLSRSVWIATVLLQSILISKCATSDSNNKTNNRKIWTINIKNFKDEKALSNTIGNSSNKSFLLRCTDAENGN